MESSPPAPAPLPLPLPLPGDAPASPVTEIALEVFRSQVFPEELSYIQRRWAAAGSERDPSSIAATEPTVAHGLCGLSFSGGGIRSATFNLGLLQALAHRGILKHVDYLSTVSGGGFVGAALTSLTRAPGSRFPFEHSDQEGEPPAVTYLRNNCNYLVPRGAVDYARMIGLLFRGIGLNMVILAPVIAVLSVVTATAYRHRLLDVIERDPTASPWSWVNVHWLTPWSIAMATAWALVFPGVSYVYRLRYFLARRAGDRTVTNSLRARDAYERTFGGCVTIMLAAVVIDFQPIILHYFHRWYSSGSIPVTGLAALVSLAASLTSGRALALLKEHGRVVGIVVGGLLGPMLPYLGYLYLAHALVYDQLGPFMGVSPSLYVLGLAALVFLLSYLTVDVNATSMHGFYRDRLSRAYIIGEKPGAAPVPEEEVSLNDICQEGSGAPYHLFNATLNLQGATRGLPRGRLSDYFVFTKHFVGSSHTGYCRTEHVVATFPFVHLATAVAVSGAAAAPNMGAFTNRPLVFLMAALNIRLGYWLPNPRVIAAVAARSGAAAVQTLSRRLWRPGPSLLLREMLSLLDAEGDAVNVSDGGHLENTGVYELLRRRCKFIIASDAEGDPLMQFHGLADVMRYARIDLGVEIEMSLDDMALGSDGYSKQHCAFGRIYYPARGAQPPEVGYLIYVKASLTRDEDGVVAEYRSRSPSFPHESTADQFFDERQFEAYRSLGYHAFDGLFEPIDSGDTPRAPTYPELLDWFRGIELALAPRVDAADQGGPLSAAWARIEEMLRAPDLAFYAREIHPELHASVDDGAPPQTPDAAERMRAVLGVVTFQLQLIERVWLALDLGQPKKRDAAGSRGWMNLLRRWAAAPTFRYAYLALVTSYSTSFQHFCKHALGLAVDYVWTPVATPAADAKLDVAAFAPAPAPAPAHDERLLLSIREPHGTGFTIGEAVVHFHGADPPLASITLHPGFDSPDVRRAAKSRLDRLLAARAPGTPASEAPPPPAVTPDTPVTPSATRNPADLVE